MHESASNDGRRGSQRSTEHHTAGAANSHSRDAINPTSMHEYGNSTVDHGHGIELASIPSEAPYETQELRSRLRIILVMTGLFLALFIAALDQTIVATAIPTISAELRSAAGYTWIGGAYLLANAAAAPIWSKLSDIWGRKPIFLAAVAWFAISSIICAVSNTMEMLIAGRALQGIAAGGLIQLVMITISDLFSMRFVYIWEISWRMGIY